MQEQVRNRDWVKNAAIIFLVVLLVLTFFSNTIMNRSLPEVATQEVDSGSIVARVRGTGTVQANSNTQVKMDRTRVIRSVLVKVGQKVEAGDVLFTLGEGASEEIDAAEEKLQSLQASYNRTAATMPEYSYTADQNRLSHLEQAYREAVAAEKAAAKAAGVALDGLQETQLKKAEEARDAAIAARDAAEQAYLKAMEEATRAQGGNNKETLTELQTRQAKIVKDLYDNASPYTVAGFNLDGGHLICNDVYNDVYLENREKIEKQITLTEREIEELNAYIYHYGPKSPVTGDTEGTDGGELVNPGGIENTLGTLNTGSAAVLGTAADTGSMGVLGTAGETDTTGGTVDTTGGTVDTTGDTVDTTGGTTDTTGGTTDTTGGTTDTTGGTTDTTGGTTDTTGGTTDTTGGTTDTTGGTTDGTEKGTEEDITNKKEELYLREEQLLKLKAALADYDSLQTKIDTIWNDASLIAARETYEKSLLEVEKWETAYQTYLNSSGTPQSEAYKQARQERIYAEESYLAAKQSLDEKMSSNEKNLAGYNVDLANLWQQIQRAQEKLDDLLGGEEATVTAKVAGTIQTLDASPGDTKKKDDVIATIEAPDMGYTLSFSVTNDQANRLRVGDTATVSNFYWGSEITATLNSIKIDQKNPQTNKILTFDLSGNVTSGTELTLSVGQKSANYDVIIPSSSVRTDANGTYVLKLESKNSPLGNRYLARRVPVEVLAVDDTNTAVSAELGYGDYVITSSSSPLKNGELVRLATSA